MDKMGLKEALMELCERAGVELDLKTAIKIKEIIKDGILKHPEHYNNLKSKTHEVK